MLHQLEDGLRRFVRKSTCGWLSRSVRTEEHSWSLSWSLESTTKINPWTWQWWWWDNERWENDFAPHDSILAKCLWSFCCPRGHRLSHESLCTWLCQYIIYWIYWHMYWHIDTLCLEFLLPYLFVSYFCLYRVFFSTGPPPTSSKYKKVDLG